MNLETLISGSKADLAKILARIEQAHNRGLDDPDLTDLLDQAFATPRGQIIGITGPPGVGKSTLISVLVKIWRNQGQTVGVIAVDPSSKRSGGALLGDRTRIVADPEDQGVFIRSMAAREQLGGLSSLTHAAAILMRALFDRVIVETVGVGQSETGISSLADTIVFCVQPGSGDSLQFMKAGIVEIPHIAVVTKADLGPPAERARADLEGALGLTSEQQGVQVLSVSATSESGLNDLVTAIDDHGRELHLQGVLGERRIIQASDWIAEEIRARFGREGLKRIEPHLRVKQASRPFSRAAELAVQLQKHNKR